MPFSEVLLVIKAAEMLALIDTPGHQAQLTAFGKKLLAAPIHEEKAQLGAQMLKLNIFQHVVKLLTGADRRELPAELILEELALRLPHEQPRQMFTTLLNWGRYGDIFGYSRDTDLFFLHRADKTTS
jgi:NitT/TauT family transport system ATP-binding protein